MYFSNDPNAPRKGFNHPTPEDQRELNAATGDAGRDGYSRLSQADRETGYRPPVRTEESYYSRFVIE